MIEIEHINKSFGEKILFSDFNLKIPDGGFYVICGNSGCGKTTLLNMIGGIENPDAGRIVAEGIEVTNARNKKMYYRNVVGFLFQNFALLENKTVIQNLEIVQKRTRSGIPIKEALEKVGLSGMEKKKVYTLSGGEQQRLALARLMVKKCSLVLADEPTGSLDSENSAIVLKILHDLNKMGKTILLVTHSKEIVEQEEHIIYL